MDDTDRKLLVLITQNPRIHYRELAKGLGISRQAVHHRLQVLTKMGVVKGIYAGVSVSYLDAVPVAISGTSRSTCIDTTLDNLGQSEFTRRVLVAGGNYLYVVGFLREISELDGYADFVRRVAEMHDPMVGIYCLDDGLMSYSVDGAGKRRPSYRALTPLDFKVIAGLKDDARKPVADIAKATGVSTKTVRRHLDAMISDGSIEFNAPMDLESGGDLFLIMHVELKDGADKRAVGKRLLTWNYFHDQYVRTYSNLPGLLMWVFWSNDMNLIRRALRETGQDKEVRSVMLNFVYNERVYLTTWRDKIPDAQLGKPGDQCQADQRRRSG